MQATAVYALTPDLQSHVLLLTSCNVSKIVN